HPVTGFAPAVWLEQSERPYLQGLPGFNGVSRVALPVARARVESSMSIQHPLSVYQQLLTEVRA
ncbi:IS21 family transposase, partial [Paraburkholderia sp. SARCC-3016]|nr:IS21 family transposase [Paraburkholderia sp. SARCC-3016]